MSNATHSIEVNAPLDRAYAAWRDFENWPKFIPHLTEALDTGERTASVKISAPFGKAELHVAIMNEHKGESFQWHTVSGDVDFRGKASFESLSAASTRVTVEMEYHPPLGRVGETIAKWLHEDPCADLPAELNNFKQMVESGEAATA
jgi:uncharacterized membrane protein